MNSTLTRFCLLICFSGIFVTTFFITTFSEEKKPYLSQEFVDTMVQNAYFNFVSAAEEVKSEKRQKNAIAEAKKVANSLKRMAKNDPNSRYILWRVNELEHQIFLEEQEVFLKKLYQKQKEINVLVSKFNKEVGKWRPGFANLIAINNQMLEVDSKKGNELGWLIKDRNKNITREVLISLEKSLLACNYEKAKKEFVYVRKNRQYLNISESKYSSLENRLRAKEDADDLIANINKYLRKIKIIIKSNDLASSKRNIEVLQDRVRSIKNYITVSNYSKYFRYTRNLLKEVYVKEDSLVDINVKMVNNRNVDNAIDFMENVLRKRGVSLDKIKIVDDAIMSIPGQRRTHTDKKVDQELVTFNNSSLDAGFNFGDVQAKVQAKKDSIIAFDNEQKRIARIEYERTHRSEIDAKKKEEKKIAKLRKKAFKICGDIYSLIDIKKTKKAIVKFDKSKSFIIKYTSHENFSRLKSSLQDAQIIERKSDAKFVKNKEKARRITIEIYTLLEENRIEEAYSKFKKVRVPMQKFSTEETYKTLSSAVKQAYESYKLSQQEPENNQIEQYALSTTYNSNSSVRLASEVKPSASNNAYATFDNKQKEAEDQATNDIIEIYNLLEQNNIIQAYKSFKSKQIPLKRYVNREAYTILENTINQAYQSTSHNTNY